MAEKKEVKEKQPTPKQIKPFLWEKGKSGNPGGRPKGIARILKDHGLTPEYIGDIYGRLLSCTGKDLQQVASGENTPMIERIVASIMLQAVKRGDQARLDSLLDRIIGKVTIKNENLNKQAVVLIEADEMNL